MMQTAIKERTRPDWLKIKLDTSGDFIRTHKLMREQNLAPPPFPSPHMQNIIVQNAS